MTSRHQKAGEEASFRGDGGFWLVPSWSIDDENRNSRCDAATMLSAVNFT
jgi:hypothetical protein